MTVMHGMALGFGMVLGAAGAVVALVAALVLVAVAFGAVCKLVKGGGE